MYCLAHSVSVGPLNLAGDTEIFKGLEGVGKCLCRAFPLEGLSAVVVEEGKAQGGGGGGTRRLGRNYRYCMSNESRLLHTFPCLLAIFDYSFPTCDCPGLRFPQRKLSLAKCVSSGSKLLLLPSDKPQSLHQKFEKRRLIVARERTRAAIKLPRSIRRTGE